MRNYFQALLVILCMFYFGGCTSIQAPDSNTKPNATINSKPNTTMLWPFYVQTRHQTTNDSGYSIREARNALILITRIKEDSYNLRGEVLHSDEVFSFWPFYFQSLTKDLNRENQEYDAKDYGSFLIFFNWDKKYQTPLKVLKTRKGADTN